MSEKQNLLDGHSIVARRMHEDTGGYMRRIHELVILIHSGTVKGGGKASLSYGRLKKMFSFYS